MNKEILAVNTIEDLISQTELLDPAFNKNDKEPSWDGFIYAYKNKNKRKSEMFGRAAVQVKGTAIDPRKQNNITYQVNYADISNYRDDGGAIFFVVFIEPDFQRKIFFASLLPFKLNELLEKHKGKKTFALHIEEFPLDVKDIEDLVINFVQNCQRQSSPTRKNWTIDELTDNFGLQILQIKYHFTDVYKHSDPFDYLFNHYTEMYVPVELTQQEYPVGSAKLEMIQAEINEPVSANGKQYYPSYVAGRTQNGYTISVGNGMLVMKTENNRTDFSFKVRGDLPTQILQSEFLLAVFDTGSIELGNTSYHMDKGSLSEKDKAHIEELRKRYEWNSDLQRTLDLLGVKECLTFDNWERKDAFYADQVIKSVLYKEPVKLPDNLNPLSIISFGNISVGVLCEKTSTGLYKIQNMFGDELNICIILDDCNVPTSQFAVLKKTDILKMSNINYSRIVDSVKKFRSQEHFFVVNLLVLEMLAAYDDKNDRDLLNATIKISKWLHNQDPEEYCYLLNWYQSVYRKNKKDKRIDVKRLKYILENVEGITTKVGAAIILGETDLVQSLLDEMTDEERNDFMQFPIVNLVRYEGIDDEHKS